MRNTIFSSKGILHPNNGWMNSECFVQALQHLHKKSGSSVENKILIMDNTECQMKIHVVVFAIKHGIVIVTLPLHMTDKPQPLDVCV